MATCGKAVLISVMKQTEPLRNSLGIAGWAYAGKYKLERYLYILHRITGLSLLLCWLVFMVRIIVLQSQGQDIWAATLLIVHNRWFGIVASLFIFHALNGLRLGLQEAGFVLGRPAPHRYPYQDALRRKRPLTIVTLVVAALLILTAIIVFFVI